jgi:hypothetical protein
VTTSHRTHRQGALVSDGPNILVFAPFDAKDDIKALPSRRWDRERRCWVVPKELCLAARRILDRWCTTVDDRSEAATDWLVEMFASVPDEHVDRVYRALSVALHPDHGGSTRLMAAVNRVHDDRVQVTRRPS